MINELTMLDGAIKNKKLSGALVFHGEEKYLLERYLERIRKALAATGASDFNYRRLAYDDFAGDDNDVAIISEAVNTLPIFGEQTLVEVNDFDICGGFDSDDDEEQKDREKRDKEKFKKDIIDLLSDVPDYCCLIFVYDTKSFKPDGRTKFGKDINKLTGIYNFAHQSHDRLFKWINSHFKDGGKTIDSGTEEYLSFVTGESMTMMNSEIEKLIAYSDGVEVTRADIDAVVTPVLDAVVYRLTDAIAAREYDKAMAVLSDLLEMREPPHRLISAITNYLRKLLGARVCVEAKMDSSRLVDLCDVKFDWQAKNLLRAARSMTMDECRTAVFLSAEAAYRLNSSPSSEYNGIMTDLLLRIAAGDKRAGA